MTATRTDPPVLDRRAFAAGLCGLPSWLRAVARARREPARALILVWLDGGMSHVDTFDGKPDAPVDIRGDLRSVESALDGVFCSEHLPGLRARMDRCALLRSLTHGEGNHDRGSHYLLTGHRPSAVLVAPSLGAVCGSQEPPAAMPRYVAIPDAPAYGGSGFVAAEHGPFEVGGDPGRPDFGVRDLAPRDDLAEAAALIERLDGLDGAPRSAGERTRDRFLRQALDLTLEAELRARFDLGAERSETRQRYGRHRLGQSCLLARRLVEPEGGCRVVLVRDRGWDHHRDVARELTFGYPPKLTALDQAVAALIDDLGERGLDERVAVCVASEFGRTPRLNPAGGRDHWPRAQSVLLFGAGLARGVAVGRTDPRGEEPVERAVGPADLHATLLAALGIDRDLVLHTADGRPFRAVETGAAPIAELLR